MRWHVAVWLGLAVYALLSVTDWVMTFALLRSYPGAVESNPVAAACLEQYGWNGLALYKAGGVLMFVGTIFLLSRRRPRVSAALVAAGCAALIAVTTYSHGLLRQVYDEQRQLAETEYPRPRKKPLPTFNGIPIPDRCVFATDHPITTASRE